MGISVSDSSALLFFTPFFVFLLDLISALACADRGGDSVCSASALLRALSFLCVFDFLERDCDGDVGDNDGVGEVVVCGRPFVR